MPLAAKDLREYGQPVKRSGRVAVAMLGQVHWELIEPPRRREHLRALPAEIFSGTPATDLKPNATHP